MSHLPEIPGGIIRGSTLWHWRARHNFHGCALAAYVDQAIEQQGRPDSPATRQRAYDYYEKALAEMNRQKSQPKEHGRGRSRFTIHPKQRNMLRI